jgi:hypothetical protein
MSEVNKNIANKGKQRRQHMIPHNPVPTLNSVKECELTRSVRLGTKSIVVPVVLLGPYMVLIPLFVCGTSFNDRCEPQPFAQSVVIKRIRN